MEFGLSPDQTLMRDSIGQTLAKASSIDKVRAAVAPNRVGRTGVENDIQELGLAAMLVPERFGGMGLKLLDVALAAEMLGAHVTPAPFVGASVMAPVALLGAGSKAQQDRWLPRIAAGQALVGVGMTARASGVRNEHGLAESAGRLTGTARFVADCGNADAFIVVDRDGGLHLLASDAPGLSITAVATIDRTRSLGDLRCEGTPAEPLQEGDGDVTVKRMIQAGRVVLAADTLGAGWAMIDQAVAYAQQRKQFGRIVGSFQAVKHMCAEMAAELEPCRSLIWYAAHAFDDVPEDAPVMVAHAKSLVDDVGRFVARTATEVHGGMGFTDLLGLHFWFKRIGLNRQLLGGPERIRSELAGLMGWGGEASAVTAAHREPAML